MEAYNRNLMCQQNWIHSRDQYWLTQGAMNTSPQYAELKQNLIPVSYQEYEAMAQEACRDFQRMTPVAYRGPGINYLPYQGPVYQSYRDPQAVMPPPMQNAFFHPQEAGGYAQLTIDEVSTSCSST